jgi:hypothetical protein
MANKKGTGDMSVYSIGGSSLLAVLKNVKYDLKFDTQDGDTVLQQGEVTQVGRRGGTINAGLYSTISDGLRVSAINASAFSIGGTDYLALLKRLRFSGENLLEDTEGAAGLWRYMQYKGKKKYSAETDLWLASAASMALAAASHNADRTVVDLALSVTLNGVAITLPMKGHEFVHTLDNGEFQEYAVSLSGKQSDTLATAYPAAPTGTTSLLEKAFNAPQTGLAFVLTSQAANGETYTGTCMIKTFDFEVAGAQVVMNNYTFETQGAVVVT